jgi:hypothetical protein
VPHVKISEAKGAISLVILSSCETVVAGGEQDSQVPSLVRYCGFDILVGSQDATVAPRGEMRSPPCYLSRNINVIARCLGEDVYAGRDEKPWDAVSHSRYYVIAEWHYVVVTSE